MGDSLYVFIAGISVMVYLLLIRCNATINMGEKNTQSFSHTLYALVAFGLFDALWGMADTELVDVGVGFFYAISFIFHLSMTILAFTWFLFMKNYIRCLKNRVVSVFESLPLLVAIVLLLMQFKYNSIFYITPIGVYHPGELRSALFCIQFFYFAYGLICAIVSLVTEKDSGRRINCYIAIDFMVILVISGFLQMLFPKAPYYSAGYMFATIVVFNGSIVIERQKMSSAAYKIQKQRSEDIYSALGALGNTYIVILCIDLINNKVETVKSIEEVDSLVSMWDSIETQLRTITNGMVTDEYVNAVNDFHDLKTLSARLKGRDTISIEYNTTSIGWCMSTIIKVDEDDAGNIGKFILSVQSIDEMKMLETD